MGCGCAPALMGVWSGQALTPAWYILCLFVLMCVQREVAAGPSSRPSGRRGRPDTRDRRGTWVCMCRSAVLPCHRCCACSGGAVLVEMSKKWERHFSGCGCAPEQIRVQIGHVRTMSECVHGHMGHPGVRVLLCVLVVTSMLCVLLAVSHTTC